MPLINYLVEVGRDMGGGLQCQRVSSGKNTLEAGQTPVTHTHTHATRYVTWSVYLCWSEWEKVQVIRNMCLLCGYIVLM